MANFEIPENPEYKEDLRKLEPTDPAHADLFNELFQVLLINQAFLKKIVEGHTDSMGIHVSEEEKKAWNGIYDKAIEYTNSAISTLKGNTQENLDTLAEIVAALSTHNHDARYFTEAECNNTFLKKANISSSSAITVAGTYALDAREKNAAVAGTLANSIESLRTNLRNLLIVERIQSLDKAIAANEGVTLSANANKAGYTPIGIVGWDCDGSGESNCRVYAVWLSGNLCAMTVRNAHQSISVTVHAFFYVLYVKTV